MRHHPGAYRRQPPPPPILPASQRYFRRCPTHKVPLKEVMPTGQAFPLSVCPGPPRHAITRRSEGRLGVWEVVDSLTGEVVWTANEHGVLCHGPLLVALPVPDPVIEEDPPGRRRGRFKYADTYQNPEATAKRGQRPGELAAATRGALTVHRLIGRLERLLITTGLPS